MVVLKCLQCGATVSADADFCGMCGHPVPKMVNNQGNPANFPGNPFSQMEEAERSEGLLFKGTVQGRAAFLVWAYFPLLFLCPR